MIVDRLERASLYFTIHKNIEQAFHYLQTTDLLSLAPGKYAIDGDNLFSILQHYETLDAANEQMEAHKKYIDVQYMLQGTELVGHALLKEQKPSKPYDEENDYMLFSDPPTFFTKMETGTFMVFFPSDLHMPCIQINEASPVKKVVVKVRM